MLLELAAACALGAPVAPERCRCSVMSHHLATVESMRPFTQPGQVAVIGRVIHRRESTERATFPPRDTIVRNTPRWVDYSLVVTTSWGARSSDTIVVRTDGPWVNCHVDLAVGEELLVLSAHHFPDGSAAISTCIAPVAIARAGPLMGLLDGAATRHHHGPTPQR